MGRRAFLRLAGAGAALGAAGCLDGGAPGARTVEMAGGFAFEPATATVRAGGTVTWENASDVGHTVTAHGDGIPDDAAYFASGGFDSERAAKNRVSEGLVATGATYAHTFEVAGTYEYYCIPHEGSGMVGTVEVDPA